MSSLVSSTYSPGSASICLLRFTQRHRLVGLGIHHPLLNARSIPLVQQMKVSLPILTRRSRA